MGSKKQSEPNKPAKPLIEGRVETEYGIYRIVAGEHQGTCKAIAYVGAQKVEATEGETIDSAVNTLKAALDERTARFRRSGMNGIPGEVEFREALLTLETIQSRLLMRLVALHRRDWEAGTTISEVARLCERTETYTTRACAKLGRKLGALLDFVPDADGTDPALAPMLTFAIIESRANKAQPLLRLRPEFLAALRALERTRGAPRI